MSDGAARVRIAVRVRPPQQPGLDECISCQPADGVLTLDHPQLGRRGRALQFNTVHDPSTSQQEFFENCAITDLLDAALDGFTATVFAYGMTGSGKTYTMGGHAAADRLESLEGARDAGLMQRAAHYLYRGMEARAGKTRFTVQATYLEVYNEQVIDLVAPRGGAPLQMRGSNTTGFYVEDLSVVQCRGLKDLEYVINKGLENRHWRHHLLNRHSSRSHAMLSIYVDGAAPRAPCAPRARPATPPRSQAWTSPTARRVGTVASRSSTLPALRTSDRRTRAAAGCARPDRSTSRSLRSVK